MLNLFEINIISNYYYITLYIYNILLYNLIFKIGKHYKFSNVLLKFEFDLIKLGFPISLFNLLLPQVYNVTL